MWRGSPSTAARLPQLYGGEADWRAIATLVEDLAPLGVPVLSGGDIWTAADALSMMATTQCAGVVVGRGLLGSSVVVRPTGCGVHGAADPADPRLGSVMSVMRRHVELLVELFGPDKGPRDFRKHVAWYLKGFGWPTTSGSAWPM